jgi:hypothetical protein
MNKYLQRILLFLIPFFIQLSILIFYIIPGNFAIYGSNDDALIASFSVDQSIGSDSDNWIFIKSLLSMPATLLQQVFPSIGVFGLVLALTIIIAISSIFSLIYFVDNQINKIFLIVTLSLTLSIFFLFSIIAPTYTGAAMYAGASGFAILLFLIRSNTKNNADLLLLASFLLALSYLIRLESFLLTFGFFLVILIIDFLFFKNFTIDRQTVKIPSIFLILVFFSNLLLETVNYKDENWQEYSQLNELRHSIQLRTAEYDLENHISDLNWSKYDYSMFRKFSLADPQKLNVVSLQTALDATESTRGIKALTSANIKNETIFINYSYSSLYWVLVIILFAFAALFVGLGVKNLIFLFYFVVVVLLSFLINFIFATSYHLPYRLTFNFIYIALVAMLVIAISEFSKIVNNKRTYELLFLMITFLLTLNFYQTVPKEFNARTDYQKIDIEIFKKQKVALANLDSNVIYVGTGSRVEYHRQNPYKPYENPGVDGNLIIIGWHNLSPIWNTTVSRSGIDPNRFHQEFLKNEKLFWIDDEGSLEMLKGFYEQYASGAVVIDDQGAFGKDFYRILKITETK